MFETLADPTRLRIVEALRDGERSVGELTKLAGIAQSGVSRHLRILQDAGYVAVRADAQRRLYALRPEPFQAIDAWMDDYRRLWDARLDRFGAVVARDAATQRQPTRKERSA
jgi:DNA-binding transcriptional ArsR family regulator